MVNRRLSEAKHLTPLEFGSGGGVGHRWRWRSASASFSIAIEPQTAFIRPSPTLFVAVAWTALLVKLNDWYEHLKNIIWKCRSTIWFKLQWSIEKLNYFQIQIYFFNCASDCYNCLFFAHFIDIHDCRWMFAVCFWSRFKIGLENLYISWV